MMRKRDAECLVCHRHDTLKSWGITVSLKRIERLTYRFGHLGLLRRQQVVNQLRPETLPSASILKD